MDDHEFDRRVVDLGRRVRAGEAVTVADLARIDAGRWPLWIELCRREGGLLARPNQARFAEKITAGRAWLGRIIGRQFMLEALPRGIDPKPAMVRVAHLARGVLSQARHEATTKEDQPGGDLAEHLLRDALINGGASASHPSPDAAVQVPVLFVHPKRPRASGVVGAVRLWRVGANGFDNGKSRFAQAPASFLLQRRDQAEGLAWQQMLSRASAMLARHVGQGQPCPDSAIAWDLLPGIDANGPVAPFLIGGGSAGGAFALGALYLMRDKLRTDRMRQDLMLIEWDRVAVTACLAGTDSDALTAVVGTPAKLAGWMQSPLREARPHRVLVAADQPESRYDPWLVRCKDIGELVTQAAALSCGLQDKAGRDLLTQLRERALPLLPDASVVHHAA